MVVAGNVNYRTENDLPAEVPVFPLEGALLLPSGQMPLNVFESRYIAMVDDALRGDRVIGMVQPRFDGSLEPNGEPSLCQVGCLGRITSFSETGDGRYIVNLYGVARFRLLVEVPAAVPYRLYRVGVFGTDLSADSSSRIDRAGLLRVFRRYLRRQRLEADWGGIERASDLVLVNALAMMAPCGSAEKQALLEAADLRARAEVLVALIEMGLAGPEAAGGATLQ